MYKIILFLLISPVNYVYWNPTIAQKTYNFQLFNIRIIQNPIFPVTNPARFAKEPQKCAQNESPCHNTCFWEGPCSSKFIIIIIYNCVYSMNYSKQDIQNIIARNKKKTLSKSPSPSFQGNSKDTNRNGSPKEIAIRYQELCNKYKQLLSEVRDKNQLFESQSKQLERLKAERERDHKQLFRLRSIIGFIKKEDKGFQVNMDLQSGGSWSTALQNSSTIDQRVCSDWSNYTKITESIRVQKINSPEKKQISKTANYKSESKLPYFNSQDNGVQISVINDKRLIIDREKQKKIEEHTRIRESRQRLSKVNRLTNSPYSKLRFSRKID